MNIIMHDAAYAFFPYETFDLFESLNSGNGTSRTHHGRLDFQRCGWAMYLVLPLAKMSDFDNDFQVGERYAGDNKCWTIPLLPKINIVPAFDVREEHWVVTYNWDRLLKL